MSVWTLLWLAWIAMFAGVEGVAVFNDVREDTLSEHLRRWFRVDTHVGRTAFLAASVVFFAWFLPHILG